LCLLAWGGNGILVLNPIRTCHLFCFTQNNPKYREREVLIKKNQKSFS